MEVWVLKICPLFLTLQTLYRALAIRREETEESDHSKTANPLLSQAQAPLSQFQGLLPSALPACTPLCP